MKLTLGFSPCPNDTFIFDALVNKKIDTGGFDFDVRLEDVETLNRLALQNRLDITKISYGVMDLLRDKYIILNSGSALGTGVGPLLISGHAIPDPGIYDHVIAIPGEHTTAHKLFSLAFPGAKNKIFMRYDEIEDFVIRENKSAGVIIHENRFTYQQKGLVKIADLGEFWEQQTGASIPLGGIVAKRELDIEVIKKIDHLIRKSIEYAFTNYPAITEYVKQHSQEMEEEVMRKHIDLYVNDYSISLGEKGKKAIMQFLSLPGDNAVDTGLFLD
jgi:1,4-dihydroxy-6-naphthoate synthase